MKGPSATVAETYDHVVGIDTHARTHTLTIIIAATGQVVDSADFPTTARGLHRAVSWVQRRCPGSVLAAVEGTSSYGASITTELGDRGITVVEVRPPTRSARARDGKSDPIDSLAAARGVLAVPVADLTIPRATGARSTLRVLLAARRLMDQQRTANRNALTALLRCTPLGVDAQRALTQAQITAISRWHTRPTDGPLEAPLRSAARRLATAVIDLSTTLKANEQQLREFTEQLAPGLQDTRGIGPVTGAILVCSYSHHGRIRSEVAFARLGGVAPRPASSGNTTRHRLDRGGDRQLNRALDTIVRTRMSFDPNTKNYVTLARSHGKSSREIRRSLKRYVARATYRQLRTCMT
ncbi:MAG: IS110 family transposase [Actinomycetales bacterium]